MHIAVKAGHYDVVVVLLLAARIRKLNLNTRDKVYTYYVTYTTIIIIIEESIIML